MQSPVSRVLVGARCFKWLAGCQVTHGFNAPSGKQGNQLCLGLVKTQVFRSKQWRDEACGCPGPTSKNLIDWMPSKGVFQYLVSDWMPSFIRTPGG